jgi:ribosome maturation protein Sdo1
MGHRCRICGSTRPNEKFSGKGHKNHICKACGRKPKEEIEEIEQSEEIFNYLRQSNISKGNISRLQKLACSGNKDIAKMANIVLEVARIKPHKNRRLKLLAKKNRELLSKLENTGMIMAHHL